MYKNSAQFIYILWDTLKSNGDVKNYAAAFSESDNYFLRLWSSKSVSCRYT